MTNTTITAASITDEQIRRVRFATKSTEIYLASLRATKARESDIEMGLLSPCVFVTNRAMCAAEYNRLVARGVL